MRELEIIKRKVVPIVESANKKGNKKNKLTAKERKG